ncbi:2,3-dihydro-2,3-dihydroxybenzoate dehydrogenase [Kitasatospora sp. NA04385]|uniref:2,3-dihydro-2,3-dihydroxybenzoate dehydrogenase n=1 Tax=Kitasatospora sp. NA04385 TaxID=2742135 RepID=UPI001592542B|nr:2,3-dihydro-2,3-dihydroxybenzoate dehydrogenase [Kitasatospora sp. NA04385]QKW18091.1 2,3-dihydro-2,3-dihydroxybenzoate dehydrogenase [Kitasatospora sp. NA04385]
MPFTTRIPAPAATGVADPGAGDGFEGRIALVTGAAQGIGAAVAALLAARGARVVGCDLRGGADVTGGGSGDAVRDSVRDSVRELDVTDGAAVEALVERVERELGPVDVLVNVAGVLHVAPALELTDADWQHSFDVNTTGVFHTCRAVGRRMAERGRGAIVTVGSNAAGVPRTGMAAYAASKAATTMYMRCLGLELAAAGVRCNLVSPGSTDTAMQRSLWTDPDAERRVLEGDPASYRVGIPLGRIADPVDVAEAVAFLAGDRARHITMHDLYVDGGATLRA